MVVSLRYSNYKESGKRIFSLAQANRSLPLVRRIVADIQEASGKVSDYQEEFEILAEGGDLELANQSMLELSEARQEYRKFCRELEQLGCRVSNALAGAVDFPAMVGSKAVVLCWRQGESRVSRWHDPGEERMCGGGLDASEERCYSGGKVV